MDMVVFLREIQKAFPLPANFNKSHSLTLPNDGGKAVLLLNLWVEPLPTRKYVYLEWEDLNRTPGDLVEEISRAVMKDIINDKKRIPTD